MTGTLTIDNHDALRVGDWCPGATAWDPHNQSTCAIGSFSKLCIADTRKMEITQQIPDAHQGGVRDVDYNPNKPLTLITAGDDRKIKVWDLRSCRSPIKCLASHSHWVWTAKYNPFHDQLIARFVLIIAYFLFSSVDLILSLMVVAALTTL